MNNFKINPCKACRQKCYPSDINCINNCCSETISAFKGVSSINDIRNSEDFQNCTSCLNEAINCMGSNTCDIRLTAAPIWSQVPHYFPELLEQTKDIEKAKKDCYSYCLDCRYTNSCIENCNTDAMAVEPYKEENKQVAEDDKKEKKEKKHKKHKSYRKTNPVSFYTGFIVGSVLFIFIIMLFLKIFMQ
jgi:hypothetical protein